MFVFIRFELTPAVTLLAHSASMQCRAREWWPLVNLKGWANACSACVTSHMQPVRASGGRNASSEPTSPVANLACSCVRPSPSQVAPSAVMLARAICDSARRGSRAGTHVQSSLCPPAHPLHHGAQLCQVGEASFNVAS